MYLLIGSLCKISAIRKIKQAVAKIVPVLTYLSVSAQIEPVPPQLIPFRSKDQLPACAFWKILDLALVVHITVGIVIPWRKTDTDQYAVVLCETKCAVVTDQERARIKSLPLHS